METITKLKSSNVYIRDIFWVFFLYIAILSVFLYVEGKIFGKEVLDDVVNFPLFFLLKKFVGNLTLFLLPILFITKVYKADIKEIGLTLQDLTKNIGLGFIAGILFWTIASIADFVVTYILGPDHTHPIHPSIQKLKNADSFIGYSVMLISIAFMTPISEEVYFRGFTYTILNKRFGKIAGIILSSLLFAVVHLNYLWWTASIFVIGIGLALLFQRTNSLVSVIIAHSINNLLSSVYF